MPPMTYLTCHVAPSSFALRALPSAHVLGEVRMSTQRDERPLRRAAIELAQMGYAIIEDLFHPAVATELSKEALTMDTSSWERSTIKARRGSHVRIGEEAEELRGDRVWWLDGCDR